MRREVIIAATVVLLVGVVGVLILNGVLGGIAATAARADRIAERASVAARRAEDAAAIAVLNNIRIEKAALAACKRAVAGTDASNRNGAIIYLVLSRTARSTGRVSPAARKSYRSLAALPLFQSRVDCAKAATDPEYEAPTPRPFVELPHFKVRQALRQGR